MKKQISFKVGKGEAAIIDMIVQRAITMESQRMSPQKLDRLKMTMDITACHANGNPLRLSELLVSEPFDFTHDVFGIQRHINRETGQLENFFTPRFSA